MEALPDEFYLSPCDHDANPPSCAVADYRRVSCDLYQSYNHLMRRIPRTFEPPTNIVNSVTRLFRASTNGVAGLLAAQRLPAPWPMAICGGPFKTLLRSLMQTFHAHNDALILGIPSNWAPATQNYTDLCITLARLTATLNYADFETRNKSC
jgi:hypothetical protein